MIWHYRDVVLPKDLIVYYANAFAEIPASERVVLNQVPLMRASEYRLMKAMLAPAKLSFTKFTILFGPTVGSSSNYQQYESKYTKWMETITHLPLNEFFKNIKQLSEDFINIFPPLGAESLRVTRLIADNLNNAINSQVLFIDHYIPQEFTEVSDHKDWVQPFLILGPQQEQIFIVTDRDYWFASCNPGDISYFQSNILGIASRQATSMNTFNRLMKKYNQAFRDLYPRRITIDIFPTSSLW